VVVTVGETDADPDVVPPVEKPVPVQEVAFVDDHVSVEDWPLVMLVGLAEREAVVLDAALTVSEKLVATPFGEPVTVMA
jgi:hypothetical protein